jgi:hypothetical protein
MNRLKLGLEAIDFQKDHPLPIELERIVQGMYDGVYKDVESGRQIIEAVKRHCGITLADVKWYGYPNFAIGAPILNRNHPFLREVERRHLTRSNAKASFDSLSLVEGSVNRAQAKVTGDYGKLEFTLHLPRPKTAMGLRVTVREYVAFILHEIGHAFNFIEFLGSNFVGNYILSDAAARLSGVQGDVDKHKILRTLEDSGAIEIDDVDAIVNSASGDEVYVLLLNNHFRKLRNLLGEDIYSVRGCEALADQFAGRMGYGRDLATVVGKLQAMSVDGYTNTSRVLMMLVKVLKSIRTVLAVLSGGVVVAGISVVMLTAMSLGMTIIGVAFYMLINPLEDEYDKPVRRLEVIRNEMVKRLKEVDLDRDERKLLVEEIDTVTKIIKSRNESTLTLAQNIATLLRPKFNKQRSSIKLQQQLEDLLATHLYVDAERLDQLA